MGDKSLKEIEIEPNPEVSSQVDSVESPLWEEEEARYSGQRRSWLMPLFLGTCVGLALCETCVNLCTSA